jgi:hypothetical protein
MRIAGPFVDDSAKKNMPGERHIRPTAHFLIQSLPNHESSSICVLKQARMVANAVQLKHFGRWKKPQIEAATQNERQPTNQG